MNKVVSNSSASQKYDFLYDYVVMIGRFEPPHIGHEMVLRNAMKLGRKVLILIGSSNQPRTSKNPWSFHERVELIDEMLSDGKTYNHQYKCLPLRDNLYNDQQWAADAQRLVADEIGLDGWKDKPPRIALIGHKKDESSYYLDMFPQWTFVSHDMDENVSATDIRRIYYTQNIKFLRAVLSNNVYEQLERFQKTSDFTALQAEYKFIENYKAAWVGAPFPPTFVTVDAVVMQSGHVLLVRRKKIPGKNLWALPGGFLNQKEKLQDGAIRELKEETKINVPEKVLTGHIQTERIHAFDHPDRSLRGRTITTAFPIILPPGPLPKVKGADDAEEAKWFPLSEVREEMMFEDHMFIIRYYAGI